MRALGEAVTRLPWLCPCAASLLAMAKAPAATAWPQVRVDPGAVLLVVRHSADASSLPDVLGNPGILEQALHFLNTSACANHDVSDGTYLSRRAPAFAEWSQPAVEPIRRVSLLLAGFAKQIAEASGRVDADQAWCAGLLAPLGWMAVAALDPDSASHCLADPELPRDPVATQYRHWGLDQGSIARRLSRRWQLPSWMDVVVSHLALPAELVPSPGAEADLLRVVQLAVVLVRQHAPDLCLPTYQAADTLAAALELPEQKLDALQGGREVPVSPAGFTWQAPEEVPALGDVLRLAAENRRLRQAAWLSPMEAEFDRLHQILAEQHATAVQQVQVQKLQALAEFAAGAGHEINNPLAVISGQAQFLLSRLGTEADRLSAEEELAGESFAESRSQLAEWQRSLRTIIGQTQRIHQMLNELMQFARPPRPQKQWLSAGELVREVIERLSDLALPRRVQVSFAEPEDEVRLHADPRQIRTALTCLLRNAIEAAPAGGWARLRLECPQAERWHFVVEDNGPGPSAAQLPHLFDPFYSGRQAGRGRGLGLPTAWRLAREHGGDVFLDDRSGGVTRFVLWLPHPQDDPPVLPLTAGICSVS
jgi:signal transduction histidine kinase